MRGRCDARRASSSALPPAIGASASGVDELEASIGPLDEPLHLGLQLRKPPCCCAQRLHAFLEQRERSPELELLALEAFYDLLQPMEPLLEAHDAPSCPRNCWGSPPSVRLDTARTRPSRSSRSKDVPGGRSA